MHKLFKLSINMTRYTLITILLLAVSMPSSALIKLPALISDNMVLQQKTDARIWGMATPCSIIKVAPSWTKEKFTTTADDAGKWAVKIPTPATSMEKCSITIADRDSKKTIGNVLIGEVWYCSGQSNMEMPMRGYKHQPVDEGLDMILQAREDKPIRMFTVGKAVSSTPVDDCDGRWGLNTPGEVAECSATAYFFADELNQALGGNVPVGIIISAWGGTTIQPWLSPELAEAEGLDTSGLQHPVDRSTPDVLLMPAVLYNAMAAPVLPYTVKGILWYQGESNISDPELYERLMPRYVESMRKGFALGDIPFYYAQIAPHDGYGDLSADVPRLRLAQSHLMKQIPNCGMAVTLDIGNRYCIHPTDKRDVGKRLAYWALAKDYGINSYAWSGPMFDRMEWDGRRALLYFTGTGGGVSPLEQELDGFEAAGDDGIYHPARAIVECETGTLSVYCAEAGEIKKVRYAHSACPEASLFDNFGLPASPFTTSGELE